jgi:hypothetical protein
MAHAVAIVREWFGERVPLTLAKRKSRPGAGQVDLFGCFDLMTPTPSGRTLFVQVKGRSNEVAEARRKILACYVVPALELLDHGAELQAVVEVWAWDGKSKRMRRWQLAKPGLASMWDELPPIPSPRIRTP